METLASSSQALLMDPFRVGDWVAFPMANRLARNGAERDAAELDGDDVRRLEPKVMEVLALMAATPGETISREAFMEEVWTGTIVTDDVLARCISELRKALGDDARNPDYVQTIRKRGYVLIAPVAPYEPEPAAPPESRSESLPAPPPVAARPAVARPRAGLVALVVAAVAVAAVGVVAATSLWGGAEGPLKVRPVTTFPGEERDPSLSPGGTAVAFVWREQTPGGEGATDLYVQSTEPGQAPVRLTNDAAEERSPAWDPAGERIAYITCGDEGCGLRVTTPEAGGAVQTVASLERFQAEDLAWSPDGERLVFSGRRGATGAFSLHLVALGGGTPQRLTAPPATYPGDLDPSFSPDGRTLAFVRTSLDGRQDVCTVSVEGGEVTRLAREQKGISGLDWTADGRAVVYAADRAGALGLWRVAREGGTPQWVLLGGAGGEISSPSVARGGAGITFARRQVETELMELRPGDLATRTFAGSTREDSQPTISADGRHVAFISTRSGDHEVWTTGPAGDAPVQLTRFGGPRVSGPRWAPDGRRLALAARPDAQADLYVVEPDGTARRLTDHPADDLAPTWSRDGRSVYFASNRADGEWQIYRLDAARGETGGAEAEQVTRHGGVAAAEAPDGSVLVVRADRKGLWRLRRDGDGAPLDTEAAFLPLRLAPADGGNWVLSGDAVYALERRLDGSAFVVRLDLATNAREWVAAADDVPQQPGLAVFPGGQRLLLTQTRPGDSDVEIAADFR